MLDGILEVQEKENNVTLNKGEMYVVKHGIEHRVVPKDHVKLLLFEPAGSKHTGDITSEIAKKSFNHLTCR